jgi:hypothetical protein
MALFSASGAHVLSRTLRSGSQKAPFSSRPELNLNTPPGTFQKSAKQTENSKKRGTDLQKAPTSGRKIVSGSWRNPKLSMLRSLAVA